jgi:hypothetical protein
VSDTPRTDEQTYDIEITRGDAWQEAIFYPCGIGDHVSAVFTRQLERELAQGIAQRDELLEALESIINADDEAEAMMRKMGMPAEEPMEIFVAARAVIAKLKGASHE